MSVESLRVGVAQLRSGDDVDANLETISSLAREAADRGCALVAFPENAPFMGGESERLSRAEPLDGRTVEYCRELARMLGISVLLGSFPELGPDARRTWNSSVLVSGRGSLLGVYLKIHLFDADIPGDRAYRESASVAAGEATLAIAELDGWRVGLTVCYDVRFPELYRALAQAGAEVLCVPAAFTFRTGAAHWELLLRARAVENGCYVVAPAQEGLHGGGRETWGHSLIVGPWGDVVACREGGVGLAVGELRRERLYDARARLPVLSHTRLAIGAATSDGIAALPVGTGVADNSRRSRHGELGE